MAGKKPDHFERTAICAVCFANPNAWPISLRPGSRYQRKHRRMFASSAAKSGAQLYSLAVRAPVAEAEKIIGILLDR
jgi:hypothetical protein